MKISKFKIGVSVLTLLFLLSCGSERPLVNYDRTYLSNDSSYKYEINHSFNNDTLKFNDIQIKQLSLTYKDEGISISQEIILPKSNNIDLMRPLIILPGFQSSRLNYLSFISYLQNSNRPILIFSYRGTGKNENLDISNFETDKKDFNNLFEIYQQYSGLEEFNPSIFASSYGTLLLIDSDIDDRITLDNICLESMPIDIKEDLNRMPFGSYIEEKKQYKIPDSVIVLEKINKLINQSKKTLMVYGLSDEYISNQEIDNLKKQVNNNKLDFLLVPKANHNIRIGFPLKQDEFDELNKKIISFLND